MGAIRPGSAPLTAAAIAAVLVAAFALLSPGERAATLGLTRHGQLVTVQDAGAADAVAAVAVSPGTAGQVLTVSDAGLPHWAAAASGGLTITTFYASDFVVEAGGATAGNATKSGTGAGSTITLTSATVATTYGTGGGTAPRAVLSIPPGAQRIEVTLHTTATTGAGDANRFFGVALRNAPSGGAPTSLWGVAFNTAAGTNIYAGGLMSGLNQGSIFTGIVANTHPFAADRWMLASWEVFEPYLGVLTGAGTAGARPTVWHPPAAWASPVNASGTLSIPDNAASALGLAAIFQSFGTPSGSLTITFEITVRVTAP